MKFKLFDSKILIVITNSKIYTHIYQNLILAIALKINDLND